MNFKIFIIAILMLLCCPAVTGLYWLLSVIFKKLLFHKEVDLSAVVFSKSRIEQVEKSDIESERNMVSIEEAVAVSDFRNQRELMMNVLRKDTSKSLGSISLALNSDDSETSHYAAAALRDTLGDFRSMTQKCLCDIKSEALPSLSSLTELADMIYPMLMQNVFLQSEQENYISILDEIYIIMEREYEEDFLPEYYERIVNLQLSVKNYDRAKFWCDKAVKAKDAGITPYKCQMRYYYSIKDGERFRDIVKKLKSSDIMIDSDTLEILRTFG